ncbi:unnamed protein product [Cylicostephanus goldi]|uniref:Uncharacterized protein n=1 Tax=Cylicostephanus goldi TaxID=71465 RepID=A0A3P6RZJ4_CYLGO|nr:unnamed protein product [Cylicostephanus goldi]
MLFIAWLSFYIDRTDYGTRLMLILASVALQIAFCSLFIYLSGVYVATTTPADVWCALLAVHSGAVVMFVSWINDKTRKEKFGSLLSSSPIGLHQ